MKNTDGLGRSRVLASTMALALGGFGVAAGCGDDSVTGTGGAGGAGGEGTTSSSAQASTTGSPATTSASTTTNVGPGGGEGGDGGAGDGGSGGAGDGGGGGNASACFEADNFADLFALETDALCVVAIYDAPGFFVSSYGSQPTWGLHGGLVTGEYLTDVEFGPITAVDVTRWSAPVGVNGELAADTTEVDLTDLLGDDADYGGAQLVDVEDGVTVFAYTGADFENEGGLVFFDEAGALEVDLLLGGVGIGIDPSRGLPIYSSLAPALDTEAGSTGLFGSEPCDAEGYVCGGFLHSSWADSSGPVAVDTDGNVFAVMTSFDGSQTARGFSSTQIEIGDETEGVDFFTVDGFGSPLAALAPENGADGLLVFQATEIAGKQLDLVDPIVVPFNTGDGAIDVTGGPGPLLTLANDNTPVSLVADDEGRIWVGVPTETGSRFAVLARP